MWRRRCVKRRAARTRGRPGEGVVQRVGRRASGVVAISPATGGGRRAEPKEGEASTCTRLLGGSGRRGEASPTAWAVPPGAVLPQIRV
ncbi:hypothetical protein ACQJBY_025459 [Aegilops geniculata]